MEHTPAYSATHETLIHQNQIPLSEFVDQFDTFASCTFPSHWHHELEFQLIISGKAKYNVNGTNYSVEEGSAIYIAPDAVHMMQGEVPGTVGYNILLLPQFLINLLQELHCNSYSAPLTGHGPSAIVINPDRKESHAILEALRKMYYMERSYPAYDLFLLEHVLRIWRNLVPIFPTPDQSSSDAGRQLREQRLKLMLSYIWDHYAQPITIQDIANSANISKSECFRCFSELSKTTPVEYVNQFRLFQASQALSSTRKSISDICYATGFNNTSYFSKKFREQYGVSPKDYRLQHREQFAHSSPDIHSFLPLDGNALFR